MALPHRISAGAIVIHQSRVLLVRYSDGHGGTYLVGPGGGVEETEELADAAIREVREETGVVASIIKLLAFEDLICSLNRGCKFWFLASLVTGEAQETAESRREGITQVGWFTREELNREKVFPWLLKEYDWNSFASPQWEFQRVGLRRMGF